ncbi:MAG: HEAT repeat domain-containing protein [Tepidisphaeraceae bacterium]
MKRPLRSLCFSAVLLTGLGGGGCTSMFTYDDVDPQPPHITTPTTLPSNEVGNTASISGTLHEIFIDYPMRLYDYLNGHTASTAVAQMEDANQPDHRREGIEDLVDRAFGKAPPYTTRYQQIAEFDDNALVRATAIRALNRSRDAQASGVFVAALDDDSPLVRLEAAKALSNIPNPNSAPPLLKVFTNPNENLDVRIAAADALRNCKSLEVARALVNVLNDRDFALSWQSRQSLRAMTGGDMHYDQTAWLDYITGPQNPLG